MDNEPGKRTATRRSRRGWFEYKCTIVEDMIL